jgi:hypothetical protein
MTPQMTSDFASNGPQPFPSSTHRRSTFGQHFIGILHSKSPFLAINAKGGESIKPKAKGPKAKRALTSPPSWFLY